MNLRLSDEQQAQLQLLSVHAGKPVAEVLLETARFLLDQDLRFWETVQRGVLPGDPRDLGGYDALGEEALDVRLATVLGRPVGEDFRSG